MSKSFIDLLFILLCGTIVMLSQSLQVGAIEATPARVGSGGISEINADMLSLVAVEDDTLQAIDPASGQLVSGTANELNSLLPGEHSILLSSSRESVTHARVMATWSRFRKLGRNVRLAASSAEPQ